MRRVAMRMGIVTLAVAALGVAASAQGTAAATEHAPQTTNAQFERRAVARPLSEELKAFAGGATQAQWLGYAVPAALQERSDCWGNYNGGWHDGACGICHIEGNKEGDAITVSGKTVKLEGPKLVTILYRAENHALTRIHIAPEGCTLDAGGLKFTWLENVKPVESVSYLAGIVQRNDFDDHGDHLGNEALTAIALQGDPSAEKALESFVAPGEPEALRKKAVFWLGSAGGKDGLAKLAELAKSDASTEVRSQVAFAMSVSHEEGAIDDMIRMAHDDPSAHVRGQALFWIAQKAGKKASATITGAIENDPDTEVKKKAVFALSQMPKDEGVPKLIEVAETNRNPEVRKQAMFWLGQSNDPRALEFFEKVLAAK